MHTIMLDGREYILRCDLNVIEKMNEKYGDISEFKADDIAEVKEAAAMMINEHFYYTGSAETVTPDFIGSRLFARDYKNLCEAVFDALNEGLKSKN